MGDASGLRGAPLARGDWSAPLGRAWLSSSSFGGSSI